MHIICNLLFQLTNAVKEGTIIIVIYLLEILWHIYFEQQQGQNDHAIKFLFDVTFYLYFNLNKMLKFRKEVCECMGFGCRCDPDS